MDSLSLQSNVEVVANRLSAVEVEIPRSRAQSLGSADLKDETDHVIVVVDGASIFESSAAKGLKKSGKCRFCRDPSVLYMCQCCGAYQCEDCTSITARGKSCNECLTITYSQRRKEELARNELAKELIPLPPFMLARKEKAKRCSICLANFSSYFFFTSFKHNCKACGEVVCSRESCVKRREMSNGKRHKVCLNCSGGTLMPQCAVRDKRPRFTITTVESTEALSSVTVSSAQQDRTFASSSSSSSSSNGDGNDGGGDVDDNNFTAQLV